MFNKDKLIVHLKTNYSSSYDIRPNKESITLFNDSDRLVSYIQEPKIKVGLTHMECRVPNYMDSHEMES